MLVSKSIFYFVFEIKNMANETGTHSIKIDSAAYAALSIHVKDRYYTIGGYASKAILTAIETELKKESRKTGPSKK